METRQADMVKRNTKDKIIWVALNQLSLHGFNGISIGSVAKAAEMSKSGLFAHFDSKLNLQVELVNAIEAKIKTRRRRTGRNY